MTQHRRTTIGRGGSARRTSASPDVRTGDASKGNCVRGYRVDWPRLKGLLRQAGLKVSDLYEPGAFPKALVSEATIKKWRPGGHASIDSLNKIAAGLSARLHWRVEWRDLIQADGAPLSIARRLLVLPLQTAPGYRSDHAVADGFRTSIVSRLTKVRGLELVAPRADSDQVETLASADVALQAVLREQGEQSRLDIDLTEMRTGIILWAESYTFLAADLLLAQTAIATSIADEIRAPLAVR